MGKYEEGMTILEVVIAITILLIGTTFIVQSNSLAYKYLHQQELQQKMVFFAAGAMEAVLLADATVLEADSPVLEGLLEGLNENFTSENLEANLVLDTDIPNISGPLTGTSEFEIEDVLYEVPFDLNYDPHAHTPSLTCFGVTVSTPAIDYKDYKMYNYKLQLP